MQEEIRSLRVFSHNLQQKNYKKKRRKLIKALRESFDQAVGLLQEVKAWDQYEAKGLQILTEVGSDCGVVVPKRLAPHIKDIKHSKQFSAVQIYEVIFLSVHMPHNGLPDEEAFDVMEEVSKLVQQWKGKPKNPAGHVVMGVDLNITLPPAHDPVTGLFVEWRAQPKRWKRDRIMEWLQELGLKALNTFEPDVIDSRQQWTWRNKRARTQIDYICASSIFQGTASVISEWPIKTDHMPMQARLKAPEALGRFLKRTYPITGWAPLTEHDRRHFREGVMRDSNIDSHGKGEVAIIEVERAVQKAAMGIGHTTGTLKAWKATQTPQEVTDAKRNWRQQEDPERRLQLRRIYRKARREWKRHKVKGKLQKMSTAAFRPSRPITALQIEGQLTCSRETWKEAVHDICKERYFDEENGEEQQARRIEEMVSYARALTMEGQPAPELDLATVLEARAGLKLGKAPGLDGVVAEVWKEVPMTMVLKIWQLFADRFTGKMGEEQVTMEEWAMIDLVGIAKVPKPLTIEQFRFIAKTVVLQKWYLSAVMILAKRHVRVSRVQVYGFRPKCSTQHVTELIRQVLHKAQVWNCPAYVVALDVETAFDCIGQGDIQWALNKRQYHPYFIAAILREYQKLTARVAVADTDPSAFSTTLREEDREELRLRRFLMPLWKPCWRMLWHSGRRKVWVLHSLRATVSRMPFGQTTFFSFPRAGTKWCA